MELSKKKERWANARGRWLNGYLVGGSIVKNKSADVYYRNALNKELDKFILSFLKDLRKVYTPLGGNKSYNAKKSPKEVQDKINEYKNFKLTILIKNSYKIVNKWQNKAKISVNRSIKEMLSEVAGKSIAINYSHEYDQALKLIVERNVQLIRNISTQTITNIENIVFNAMTTGRGWQDIEDSLYNQIEVKKNRVKTIARDQTAKANQAINQIEQMDAGIEYFMWKTAQDERVRERHRELNNKIYKWGDVKERLPIIDPEGTRGYPADAVNCRCNALAVFILDGYMVKWNENKHSYEVRKKR